MSEVLSIAEIESKFESEWVLIDDPETNDALEVQSGKVLFHSKDKTEFDRKVIEFRLKRFAVIYTGKPPKGMEFAL
jgi:hypothetical protein